MAMKMRWLLQSVRSCIMGCRPSGREHIGISVSGYRVEESVRFGAFRPSRSIVALVQWVDEVVEACTLDLGEWESNFFASGVDVYD